MKAATYLKHNAKEAIEVYKTVFGTEVVCEYFYNVEDLIRDTYYPLLAALRQVLPEVGDE